MYDTLKGNSTKAFLKSDTDQFKLALFALLQRQTSKCLQNKEVPE